MITRDLLPQLASAIDDSPAVALLGIANQEALLSHPVVGASWEAYVIENLLAWPDNSLWAIEIKRSLNPMALP